MALKFHLTHENKYFNGKQTGIEESKFILFGVPFDSTSTYRAGSREAPQYIRDASINIETYSFRTSMDALELKIHDAGDMPQIPSVDITINMIMEVVNEIRGLGKTPIMIGGEHTITYGALKALKDPSIIIFDAHMDLRDEYPQGVRWSHATISRRIAEEFGVDNIAILGVRATCREEMEYAKNEGINFKTSMELMKGDISYIENLKRNLSNRELWISIDLDVLDPSIAPAVGNPEPEGITLTKLLDIMQCLVDKNIVGFDLVEVSPKYDNGITSIVAAKTILETACMINKIKS
ncbi:MAG: agmatinase [Candidatus Methanomethylicia archaeon]